MRPGLIRICLFVIMFTCFISKSAGQGKKDWAEITFDSFSLDAAKDFRLISKYGDTLIEIFQNRQDYYLLYKTQLHCSYFQNHLGDFKKSLRYLFMANQNNQLHPIPEKPITPDIYLGFASLYMSMGEKKREELYVNKGIASWNSDWKEKATLIRLYLLKGDLYDSLNDQLAYFNRAYKLAVENRDTISEEKALNSIGTAYAISGQNEKATDYLKKALALGLKRKAYNTLPSHYNNLAGLTNDPLLVRQYIDSSLYYSKISGDYDDLQTALQNKALFCYQQEKYKEGYDLLWESFEVKDSLFNKQKANSFAEMEQRFESEKKNIEINFLQSANEIANLKASRNLGINFGLGGALLGILSVTLAFYYQNKKKQKLNNELTVEKAKSDELLLNILPEEIAVELKSKGRSEAKLYNKVTVLFTDFVNFTGISEQMGPTELVQEIHQNFTAFDAIMEKYGIEKIKTIGDAYLAVCGLPHGNENHARQIILAAMEIQEYMIKSGGKFQIRIGINSGAVVAGIVGVKKYAYDIWGDTVNTAARMEQYSEAGKINISGATYTLISEEFECEYRGKVNAKNKGEIDMYFVNRSLGKG